MLWVGYRTVPSFECYQVWVGHFLGKVPKNSKKWQFLTKVSRSVQMKMSPKMGSKSQKAPIGIKTTRVKLNDCVRLERGHLSWFRYPTHKIGTYLGRGVTSF